MEEVTRNTEIADGRERKRVLRVDVIIPTYKPGKKFSRLLKMLSMQTYPIGKIIVMNTEKAYWNDKGFEGIGNLEVHHLSKEEFDHGATRNRGARCSRADIMVFMTDDAVPADERLIEHLAAARLSIWRLPLTRGGPAVSRSSWPMPGSCRIRTAPWQSDLPVPLIIRRTAV